MSVQYDDMKLHLENTTTSKLKLTQKNLSNPSNNKMDPGRLDPSRYYETDLIDANEFHSGTISIQLTEIDFDTLRNLPRGTDFWFTRPVDARDPGKYYPEFEGKRRKFYSTTIGPSDDTTELCVETRRMDKAHASYSWKPWLRRIFNRPEKNRYYVRPSALPAPPDFSEFDSEENVNSLLNIDLTRNF